MPIPDSILAESLMQATGMTLVHSLWQSSLVALLLWIALSMTGKKRASARYIASSAALGLIVIITVCTFIKLLSATTATAGMATEFQPVPDSYPAAANVANNAAHSARLTVPRLILTSSRFFENYYSIIVFVWLTGVVFFSARFTGGIIIARQLRRKGIKLIPPSWSNTVTHLCRKIGIRRRVAILESLTARVPMVIGALKPVILVPAGLLTGIPYNQVEAIIAHELAHIKRNDFLVNLMQSIIEIVLFYHPAVWWISGVIRDERENCCDDHAVKACGDPLAYAKALISLQESVNTGSGTAVALTGNNRNHKLTNRIKRIIKMKSNNSNITERLMAVAILVMLVTTATLVTGFTQKANYPDSRAAIEKPVADIQYQDTLSTKKSTISTEYKDPVDNRKKRVKMEIKDGVVYELYINSVRVPEEEMYKYQDLIDKTIDDLESAREEIRNSIAEIENMDFEDIRADLERVREEIKDIDHDAIKRDVENAQKEIKEAIEEIKKIDHESLKRDIEEARRDMQEALEEIKITFNDMDITMDEMNHFDFDKVSVEMDSIIHNLNFDFDIDFDHDFRFDHDFKIDSIAIPDNIKILEELERSIGEIENALPPSKKSGTLKEAEELKEVKKNN